MSAGVDRGPRRWHREVPKAVAKITGDIEVLLAFYDFPVEHSRATTTVLVLTP